MTRQRHSQATDPQQPDLLTHFEAQPPPTRVGSFDIDSELRHALSRALKDCDLSRYEVAAAISELVGAGVSKHMLDAYTAESHEGHKFPVQYLPAFVAVTGAAWVLDLIARKCGCIVLEGECATPNAAACAGRSRNYNAVNVSSQKRPLYP
jgi:hypothetical protein